MISLTRGNQNGSDARSAASGRSSRNQAPLPCSYAPCSPANTAARVNSAKLQISPSIPRVTGSLALIVSAIRQATPQANSSLVCARTMVCCIALARQLCDITLL